MRGEIKKIGIGIGRKGELGGEEGGEKGERDGDGDGGARGNGRRYQTIDYEGDDGEEDRRSQDERDQGDQADDDSDNDYDNQEDPHQYGQIKQQSPYNTIPIKNRNPPKNPNKTSNTNSNNQYRYRQLNRKFNILIIMIMFVLVGLLVCHFYLQNFVEFQQGGDIRVETGSGIKGGQEAEEGVEGEKGKNGKEIQKIVDEKRWEVQVKVDNKDERQKPVQMTSQIQPNQKYLDTAAQLPQKQPQPNPQQPQPHFQQTPRKPPIIDSVNQQRYAKTTNLLDFQTDEVYVTAPPQIKQIFDQMIKRPASKTSSPQPTFMPTQKAYFAYRLYQQPDNQRYLKAELYYYQRKYRIGDFGEKELCVVAPGRNVARGSKFRRFIDSVQRQNYSNYKLVYIDDVSDDNSPQQLQKYIKQTSGPLNYNINSPFPPPISPSSTTSTSPQTFIINPQKFNKQQDKRRMIIVKNQQRLYALANRNQAVRKYCPENSIVLDVDADDALIGRQAFKFVNAVYGDQDVWMFNSVFIYDTSAQKEVTTGPQEGVPLQILQANNYRTSMIWKTSQLRTFKAKLFCKIDQNDFKDNNGQFYQWASDVFTQQPLVQLAGPKHYKHLYEIVYFYDWYFDRTTVFKRRHYRDVVFMQTPYRPLGSLEELAQKVEGYEVPEVVKEEYEKNIREGRLEAQRYHRPPPF